MAPSSTRRLGSVAAHLRASPVGEERKKSSAEECVLHALISWALRGRPAPRPSLLLTLGRPRGRRMSSSRMADNLRRRSSQLPSEGPPATGTVWCAAFLSRLGHSSRTAPPH